VADVPEHELVDPSAWETLARRPGETLRAHAAFLDYVRMGPGRSLRKLFELYRDRSGIEAGSEKPPTKRLNTLREWSVSYAWQKRLEAWTVERGQRDQALWEQRRRELREADWQTGEKLREQANAALDQVPQFLKTTRRVVRAKGQPEREVITMGLKLGEVAGAAEIASKLQRLAAEMPTERQQVDATITGVTADDLAKARDRAQQFEDELLHDDGSPDHDGSSAE
jgi:hypothetical protein